MSGERIDDNLKMVEGQPTDLDEQARIVVPAMAIPGFRTSLALQRGVENNILIQTWGGLGDQICAEPTLRYALKTFKGCDITLASECPELFGHLKFKDVVDLRKVQPHWSRYLAFNTIYPIEHMQWQFMSHMITNCVDYPSLCAFRCQLPVADREVCLVPPGEAKALAQKLLPKNAVILHPGKHWPSKTFPKDWWDDVITGLAAAGVTPVLIGANTKVAGGNQGTVDVNAHNAVDLRNKLSVMESVALLQAGKVLITNDSSPLHMAVSGDAQILYIATCKHPDYITHWRRGVWGYRMKNMGLGGIWDHQDYLPNKTSRIDVDKVPEEMLRSWLPPVEALIEETLSHL